MSLLAEYHKATYQSQVSLQNGLAYYTGLNYPDIDFFNAHWNYGNGTTLIIPSSLAWNEITARAPGISRLEPATDILISGVNQHPIGSVYKNRIQHPVNYYKAYDVLVTSPIPYSLGNSTLIADVQLTRESLNVVSGTIIFTLAPDGFDFNRNGAENERMNPLGIAKDIGLSLAGPGIKYKIEFSGNTALEISGTVANIASSMNSGGSGYYPVENSTRTILTNYQRPDTPPTTVDSPDTNYTQNVAPPIGLGTTRDSKVLVNSTGQHTASFNAGGGVDDLWLVQKAAGNSMTREEFRAAFAASNASVDLNTLIVKQGVNYYIPQKLADGSITYHYAGGASINTNASSGEYHMVIPNADGTGGQTVYSRTYEGNGLGGEGYSIKQFSTDAAGNTTYDFTGRQSSLTDAITPIRVDEQIAPGYLERQIDTDGNGTFEQHQVITPSFEVKDLDVLPDLLDLEYDFTRLNQSGQFSTPSFNSFTDWSSDQLLGTGAGSLGSGTFGLYNDFYLDPIGAFYDSQSASYDSAASIAIHTPVVLTSGLQGLSVAQLTALDTDLDQQLSELETANLRLWQDLDQNGLAESGEIINVTSPIKAADYNFYSQGNSKIGATQAEVGALAPLVPPAKNHGVGIKHPFQSSDSLAQPSGNYRALRDSDNVYPTFTSFFVWQSNQIKINWGNNSYVNMVGTDGNDTFDANYFASSAPSLNLNTSNVKNFIGGNGDDVVGGSSRNDNIWGGTENDTLLGYSGDDRIFGEDGNDQLQGNDGNDALYGGSGDDALFAGSGNDYLDGGLGNDFLVGDTGNDRLFGDRGNDEIQGGEDRDQLHGNNGDDRLFGQAGDDVLWGGEGNDLLMGFTASNEAQQTLNAGQTDEDVLFGEGGNDNMAGGLGNDVLHGELGNDLMDGGAGNDVLLGEEGDDELQGSDGHDVLDGGTGADLLLGGAGNDTLQGADGNDELQGGVNSDLLVGELGDDKLFGQAGDDTLAGGEGNDILVGFTANNELQQSLYAGETDDDLLYGEGGNDNLYGGLGNDRLDGGEGADIVLGDAGDDRLWGADGNDELQGNDVGSPGTELEFAL